MNNNDYVSKMTKEYMIGQKDKKIKKIQQKQFQYGLRGFRKESNSFNRKFN